MYDPSLLPKAVLGKPEKADSQGFLREAGIQRSCYSLCLSVVAVDSHLSSHEMGEPRKVRGLYNCSLALNARLERPGMAEGQGLLREAGIQRSRYSWWLPVVAVDSHPPSSYLAATDDQMEELGRSKGMCCCDLVPKSGPAKPERAESQGLLRETGIRRSRYSWHLSVGPNGTGLLESHLAETDDKMDGLMKARGVCNCDLVPKGGLERSEKAKSQGLFREGGIQRSRYSWCSHLASSHLAATDDRMEALRKSKGVYGRGLVLKARPERPGKAESRGLLRKIGLQRNRYPWCLTAVPIDGRLASSYLAARGNLMRPMQKDEKQN